MDFKKARIITEEIVKQAVEMAEQCDRACQNQDCACELYLNSLECNDG